MVWERWMRSKLSPPDGDRIDPDDEDEDIDELEESDNVRFDCQLAAIGLLSRISLPQCLPNLNKLTQSKLSIIAKCLQEGYQNLKKNKTKIVMLRELFSVDMIIFYS